MPDIFDAKKQGPTPLPPQPVQPQPVPQEVKPVEQAVPEAKQVTSQPVLQSQYSPLKALLNKPTGISFENQENDEDILLLLHASFITNIPWLAATIVLVLLPLIVLPFFALSSGINILASIPPPAIIFITLFYYLLILGYAYINFISWFYNTSIVTNRHVIDLIFSNISYKKIDTASIADLADISYSQQGFIQTFFDFGKVTLAPQAQNRFIIFENVPQPNYVTDFIQDIKEGTVDKPNG